MHVGSFMNLYHKFPICHQFAFPSNSGLWWKKFSARTASSSSENCNGVALTDAEPTPKFMPMFIFSWFIVGVALALPNSCRSTRVGSGSTEVCDISDREVRTLACNEDPKRLLADPATSLDDEYSRTSKNCPKSINNFRFWRVGSSLAT